MYRVSLHGDAQGDRAVEVAIGQAFEVFVGAVEAISGHGAYLAQMEGDTGYQRWRGGDTTMTETSRESAAPTTTGPFTATVGSEVTHG